MGIINAQTLDFIKKKNIKTIVIILCAKSQLLYFLPHNSQFLIRNSILIQFHVLNIHRSYLKRFLIYLNTFAF